MVVWLLSLPLGLFSSRWVSMPNFEKIVFTSSFSTLFCHAWLLSLEACSSRMKDRKGVDLDVGRRGGTGRSGGRGNYNQGILYEK